ncbi:MAG: hypothetical protein JW812_03200 [Alphaproteobacteria bacterium]|nr:hypothetical protein [Alphaproteobacteria bacterium]MBN2779851.1 hypothetical protein [Alphaproteobacteria bacterium]
MFTRLRNLIGYLILGAIAAYGTYYFGNDFGQKYVAITKSALLKTVKKTVDHVQEEAKRAVGRAQSQAKQSVLNIKNAARDSRDALKNSAKKSGQDLVSGGKGMFNVGNIVGLATGQKSVKDIEAEAKAKAKAEEDKLRNAAKSQEDVLKAKVKAEEDRLKAELKKVVNLDALEAQIKNDVLSATTYAIKKHWDILLAAILSLFVLIGSVFLSVKNIILFILILLGKTTVGSVKLVSKGIKGKKKK